MTLEPSLETVLRRIDHSNKLLMSRKELMAYDTASEPWQRSLGRRYKTHHEMKGVLNNIVDVNDRIYDFFDMRVTPYLAQLMDENDPDCPIRRQYLPSGNELNVRDYELADSLNEDDNMAQGTTLVHRYPNRVLLLVTTNCATYCRYCTRKRFVSHAEQAVTREQINHAIAYLATHQEVEDCLLSGGDPLFLADNKLDEILARIRGEAPHVKFLRISTRLPVQLPTRVTPELCDIIEKHDVQMVNVHVNHPKEVTSLFAKHIKMLRKTGTMLGNQAVLLKGVNDDVYVLRDLCMDLIEIGIRPYYVYANDNSEGNWHFTVSLERMKQLYHGLRGWISGPAVPTFVVDGMHGLGKMPVMPEYVKQDGVRVIATNYAGKRAEMTNLERAVEY